jgi:hypothetical protein
MPLFKFPVSAGEADAFQTATLPYAGDVDPGSGMTTSSATNANVLEAFGLSADDVGPNDKIVGPDGSIYGASSGQKVGHMATRRLAGNPAAESPLWTMAIALGILAWLKLGHKGGEEGSKIKITLGQACIIYLMWLPVDLAVKAITGYYYIASVSNTIQFS